MNVVLALREDLMLTIDLREMHLASGDVCRGRAQLALDGPTQALRAIATLTCSQSVRSPFSGEPATKQVFYQHAMEISGTGSYCGETLSFELPVPSADELEELPQPPQFLRKLVSWIDPDAIGPVVWELEVRLERRWKTDVVATSKVDIVLDTERRAQSA